MDFSELEDAAIDLVRASPALPLDVRVSAWPDSPGSGQAMLSGVILIRFLGLDLAKPRTMDRVSVRQEGTISFEARLFVKNLRTHSGAYPLVSAVQQRLSGWLPALSQPLSAKLPGCHLSAVNLVGRKEQVWDWGMLFSIDVISEQVIQ